VTHLTSLYPFDNLTHKTNTNLAHVMFNKTTHNKKQMLQLNMCRQHRGSDMASYRGPKTNLEIHAERKI